MEIMEIKSVKKNYHKSGVRRSTGTRKLEKIFLYLKSFDFFGFFEERYDYERKIAKVFVREKRVDTPSFCFTSGSRVHSDAAYGSDPYRRVRCRRCDRADS
jgi:hypothetical protein